AVDCSASGFGNAGWLVGFLGYKGVSFRNMQVSKGLVVPNPSASPSAVPTVSPTAVPTVTPSATSGATATPVETLTPGQDNTEAPSTQPATTAQATQQPSELPTATSEVGANPNTSESDYSYIIVIAGVLLLASVVFAIYRYKKDRVRGSEE
ncbi:MAG: hypothetical protein IKU26_02735, partial [Clostridia bacterium]|nr:hypothetical protein [Clostridia bacterium]